MNIELVTTSQHAPGMVNVYTRCPTCKKQQMFLVNAHAFYAWKNGKLTVQDAFPDLSPNGREALITGFCGDCWDTMFASLEDADAVWGK